MIVVDGYSDYSLQMDKFINSEKNPDSQFVPQFILHKSKSEEKIDSCGQCTTIIVYQYYIKTTVNPAWRRATSRFKLSFITTTVICANFETSSNVIVVHPHTAYTKMLLMLRLPNSWGRGIALAVTPPPTTCQLGSVAHIKGSQARDTVLLTIKPR